MHCLYDLSATTGPRCPECGRAFDPRDADTTLPTDHRAPWIARQITAVLRDWLSDFLYRRRKRAFCRECLTDLSAVRLAHHCPVCGAWFEISDPHTYLRSNHAFAQVWERFRHVCFWRGVLLPLALAIYGAVCIATEHALLPGAGRGMSNVRLIDLEGAAAIMMGIAWLGGALALHARYFWGRVEPVWRFADLGLVAGVVAIIIGWGYALYAAMARLS